MKRILFSPVGSTDPIAGQHDGAILHILRHYEIDEVYLYFSKEMCELEAKDHRYTYCIDQLKKLTGKHIEFHAINRPDLIDVHIFDGFLLEFKKIIEELLLKEVDELILNVSSGTPAMKSALQILGATAENQQLVTVQVSTPSRAYNKEREDVKGDYDVELQWAMNLDNEENAVNRCSISSNINLAVEIKKNVIRKQVASFDYVAARNIAIDMEGFLDDRVISLLQAASCRIKLDKGNCLAFSKCTGYNMLPHQTGNECSIFEAFLLGKIKIQREEYSDFLRGISPLFFAILERIIEKQLGINVKQYYIAEKKVNGTLFVQWDEYKVKEDQDIVDILTRNNLYDLKRQVVTTAHLVSLIEKKSDNLSMKEKIRKVRTIEEEVRNPIAHCITYLTDDILKASIGYSAMDIFNRIKDLMGYAGIKVTENDLRSYEMCNDEIVKYF